MREVYPKQKENVRDEKQRKDKIREIHQAVQHSLNSSRKKDEGKLKRETASMKYMRKISKTK